MRLIDADSLKERMFAETPEHEKGVVDIFLEAVAAMIDEQPTIERKTGKWIKKGAQMHINLDNAREQYTELGYPHRNISALMCDVCRKITLVDESIKYNFCPHCGADMRGEK